MGQWNRSDAESGRRGLVKLGNACTGGWGGIAVTIEVNLEGPLSGVQNEPTVLTGLEVLTECGNNLGGKSPFQIIANCSDCRPASHRRPQNRRLYYGSKQRSTRLAFRLVRN